MEGITAIELENVIHSVVLTLENDAKFYDAAQRQVRARNFVSPVTMLKAMHESGVNDTLGKLNVTDRGYIKSCISARMCISFDVELEVLQKELFGETHHTKLNRIVEWTNLRIAPDSVINFDKIKPAVANHLTAEAFNNMTDKEQATWIYNLYSGETTSPTNSETVEKTTMQYSEKAKKLQEVFGVIITGRSKASLMDMIRSAQEEVKSFSDLDQSSKFVSDQVQTLNSGIKLLYAELDK